MCPRPFIWAILLLNATALLCSERTLWAQECDALKPQEAVNKDVSNRVKADANILSKRLGNISIEDQFRKIQQDVLYKYPNAHRIVIWKEFIYLKCTSLRESHLSDQAKQQQIKS
jgi:hypothetical protein